MYEVVLLSRKWRLPVEYYYFPGTVEGLRRAKEKWAELIARHLDHEVELNKVDNTRRGTIT